MILDKLLKTFDFASRIIIHPLYQIFPQRLVVRYFDEVKTNYIPYHYLKKSIIRDMQINGLLVPIIINKDNEIVSGRNRFNILKKEKFAASLFYKINNDNELEYLIKVGEKIWNMHKNKKTINDWNFLFEDDINALTEKNFHILKEGVLN